MSKTVDYGPFSLSYAYEYYANGLKKSFTDPSGVKIIYSYLVSRYQALLLGLQPMSPNLHGLNTSIFSLPSSAW
ncbi:MAG: hypothetical protein VSS75_018585 [Candidatus Parabeggiatoa sp.]|nr:hypothetical protein [Candidatus Parabeggiatoa sp.]HIE02777.1 hypothetical protein [Thiotrichaceae bacterium]